MALLFTALIGKKKKGGDQKGSATSTSFRTTFCYNKEPTRVNNHMYEQVNYLKPGCLVVAIIVFF